MKWIMVSEVELLGDIVDWSEIKGFWVWGRWEIVEMIIDWGGWGMFCLLGIWERR